eukprot:126468_1
MAWDCRDLTSFTVTDIKIMLRNRGATSAECSRRKNELIPLLKQNYDMHTFPWPLMDYTAKSIKVELLLRDLDLGGNKQQLVQRLTDYISTQMAQPSQIRMNNNRKRRSDQFLLPTAKKRRTNQTNKNHNCNPKITTSPSPSIELQVLEANKSVLCPLTHLKFQHPVKSIRCNHTFERCAIHEYISTKAEEMPNQNVECPMFGCCHSIAITDLERDEQMVASMTNVNPNTNDTSNVLDWTHLSDGEGDRC